MNPLQLSWRYIRSRKLESSLGIVGIILGVATLAGTLSLIASYQSYYDKFSQSPASRQVRVLQSSRVDVTDAAAVLIGTTEIQNVRFTADEAKAAMDVCPDVDSFYDSQYRTFNTTASTASSNGFGGFGGGFGGGPGGDGGGPPPDAGSTAAATTATTTATTGAAATATGATAATSKDITTKAAAKTGATEAATGNAPSATRTRTARAAATGATTTAAAGPAAANAGGPPDGFGPPGMFNQPQEVIDPTLEKPTLEQINGGMVSGGFFAAYSLKPQYGDIFSDAGDNSGTPGVVLGATLAKKVYASVTNPADLIGKKLVLSNTTYNIIGVLAYDEWNSSGRNITYNEMAFVPTQAMRSGAAARARYNNLTYTTKSTGSPAKAAIQLENYFNSIHGAGSVMAEANLDMFYKEVTKRERILTLMTILAAASALTAAINLFNLMTSRVMRRKKPIAIMRALGSWNMRVFGQIMIEASMIGMAGAVCGIALSPIVVNVLANMLENSSSQQSIPVSVNLPVLVAVGIGALVVSLVFAAIPAKNGSSLVITDSLRTE